MKINVKESCCMRVGPRCNANCANQRWSIFTMGLWNEISRDLRCQSSFLQMFFQSLKTVILWCAQRCKLLNLASEVILELVKSKCLPILLYGLEYCNMRSADLHWLDFTYNRLFMKLFRTKSIDVVKDCQYFFGAVLPSVLVLRKADKLTLRYQCLENAFCTYWRPI